MKNMCNMQPLDRNLFIAPGSNYATAHSEGSTIPYARWAGSLEKFDLIVPPLDVRRAFHSLMEPFIGRMMGMVDQSATLSTIRDALLPKLISGELRVPDAERIVRRASG